MTKRDLSASEAAAGFAALGSEPRLDVLRSLIRAGRDGLTIAEIQLRTAMPPSTLAHHLRLLRTAGLIEQTRNGRSVLSRARFAHLEALAGYLLDQCCADVAALAPRRAAS
jgi:DNA-binding transcriptional ArsR family regulator